MTRSSPSYAKRGAVLFLVPRLFKGLSISVPKNGGDQKLADAEWDTHRPGRERLRRAACRQAEKSGRQIPHTDDKHLPRKKPARREHSQAEDQFPEAGQHPALLGS